MSATVRLRGGDKLMRALRELPKDMQAPVRAEVRRGGELVLAEAQRRVPVDTGALRDALASRSRAGGLRVQVGLFRNNRLLRQTRAKLIQSGVHRRGATKAARALIGMADTFYASFVEFGTRHMRARPFLLPAAALYRSRIRAAIANAARRALDRGAGGPA